MQQLRQASALLCTACIAAELIAQLTGSGWPRRCIKAAAGVYILAVLMQLLPGLRTQWDAFEVPAASTVSFGTMEEAVLHEAETQLALSLAAQCKEETGAEVELEITLIQAGAEVVVQTVHCTFPAECSAQQRQAAAEFLRGALGTEPQTAEGGDASP